MCTLYILYMYTYVHARLYATMHHYTQYNCVIKQIRECRGQGNFIHAFSPSLDCHSEYP
jgi:hypothetical protein